MIVEVYGRTYDLNQKYFGHPAYCTPTGPHVGCKCGMCEMIRNEIRKSYGNQEKG